MLKIIGYIYIAVVAYMVINFGVISIDMIRSEKRNRLSIVTVLDESVQEILKMRPGHSKMFKVWTQFVVALAGLICTVPALIKTKIQFHRDNTVRY